MADWHNWKASVDQCHQKHIGPPPPSQRRIAYLEAHRWAAHDDASSSIALRLKTLLRRLTSSIIGKLL
jgi:hypothetical protein